MQSQLTKEAASNKFHQNFFDSVNYFKQISERPVEEETLGLLYKADKTRLLDILACVRTDLRQKIEDDLLRKSLVTLFPGDQKRYQEITDFVQKSLISAREAKVNEDWDNHRCFVNAMEGQTQD